jgi:hypothetical protein
MTSAIRKVGALAFSTHLLSSPKDGPKIALCHETNHADPPGSVARFRESPGTLGGGRNKLIGSPLFGSIS